MDALLHVVRVFDDPQGPHPDGTVDPLRDVDELETELVFADLVVVEKRLERVESDLGKGLDKAKLGAEQELLRAGEGDALEDEAARDLPLDSRQDDGRRSAATRCSR